ncbi:hypothetical protein LCGC14_1310720 [marine sediment metagenome]|uniref:Uncharacterized protein n=1 Tax=marine sediment metagenome TaxID=412755 RepID=A0A0F9NPW0_9ZZZZ
MTVKAGYKGAVWYGTDYKIASGNWTYSGETRNMQDIDEFQDEIVKQLPLQIVGGDITITGNYLLDQDTGQKQLKVDFDAATEITNLRLYTDKTNAVYMTPKAGSHMIVTNVNNVGDDKSGVGTITATLHVNGELEQVGSTTAAAVATLGEIDNTYGAGNTGQVSFWGELIHRGGEAGDIECYFEYGLTESFGDTTFASETTFSTPDKGEYDADSAADLITDTPTLYYYRAVIKLADTTLIYGETKSFTTLDS